MSRERIARSIGVVVAYSLGWIIGGWHGVTVVTALYAASTQIMTA